jgi:hypothetical protein
MLTEITRVLPRAATPETFFPTSTPPPLIAVQVAPPLVLRRRPVRAPPVEPKLLNRPMPATSVLRGGSVGSRSRAPIELEAWSSVSRVHLGFCDVAFVIFQTPPLTAPTYRVPAALGWATTVWIAPTTSPSSIPSTWPSVVGPGPWGSQTVPGERLRGAVAGLGAGAAATGRVSRRAARPNRLAARLRLRLWGRRSTDGNSRTSDTMDEIDKGHLPDERVYFWTTSGAASDTTLLAGKSDGRASEVLNLIKVKTPSDQVYLSAATAALRPGPAAPRAGSSSARPGRRP